jgi:hypothetical protein
MKPFIIAVISSGLITGAFAQTTGDDFNDNHKDSSKWGTDELFGNGRLKEANAYLGYTCTTGTLDDDDILPWIANRGPYTANWEAQLDIVNNTTISIAGQVNSFGLKVRNPSDSGDEIFVELYNSSLGSLPARRGFDGAMEENDVFVASGDTGEAPTTGSVRLTFDATTKVFTCYYATNNHDWIELSSFGIAGSGGSTTNANWAMTDTDTFPVYVYGYSTGMAVSVGTLYADNFSITGGVGGGGGGATNDLALVSVKVPKKVTLSASHPSVTKPVKVTIQNLGSQELSIPDLATLGNLVPLTIESLGFCPAPIPVLQSPKKGLPVTLGRKKKLTVVYNVTFDCPNDGDSGNGHEDFRYTASVEVSALGDGSDANPANDGCPRAGSSDDKGCNKGADALTDVIAKD